VSTVSFCLFLVVYLVSLLCTLSSYVICTEQSISAPHCLQGESKQYMYLGHHHRYTIRQGFQRADENFYIEFCMFTVISVLDPRIPKADFGTASTGYIGYRLLQNVCPRTVDGGLPCFTPAKVSMLRVIRRGSSSRLHTKTCFQMGQFFVIYSSIKNPSIRIPKTDGVLD
jgi:hypothetical protein